MDEGALGAGISFVESCEDGGDAVGGEIAVLRFVLLLHDWFHGRLGRIDTG
jgi:hypothetical protein